MHSKINSTDFVPTLNIKNTFRSEWQSHCVRQAALCPSGALYVHLKVMSQHLLCIPELIFWGHLPFCAELRQWGEIHFNDYLLDEYSQNTKNIDTELNRNHLFTSQGY